MRLILMKCLALGLLIVGFGAQASGEAGAVPFQEFSGHFENAKPSSDDCAFLLDNHAYTTKVFRVGPNKLSAVVYFQNNGAKGVLNDHNLIGSFGGFGDIMVEANISSGDYQLSVVGKGVINKELLLLDISMNLTSVDSSDVICTATARYVGLN